MKINIGYSTKSIDKAIKQIEEYQKRVKSIIPTFYKQCGEKIVQFANERLNGIDLPYGVLAEIKSGWQPVKKKDDNTYILENTSDESVYIEFGVGIVGEQSPQAKKEADEAGYKYNLPSPSKYAGKHHDENTWRFYVSNKSEIDLIDGNYEEWQTKDGRIKIITRGSQGVMYAFNAIQDFIDSEAYVDIAKQLFKGL